MIDKTSFEDLVKKIHSTYVLKRPRSELLYREARRFLPGGDTRSGIFYRPFPTFMERGERCRLYDADGNAYIDFVNNNTSLVHGHAHPRVVEAVVEQIKRGSIYGSPVDCQSKFAQEICNRLPSAEKVRFCNSGTEATLFALRLARFYRKRYKVVKMEGGYHGSYDLTEISIRPPLEKAGHIERPNSMPEDIGIAPNIVSDCIIAPFNNISVAERIISENHEDLGAIIVEPVQGSCGMVPSDPHFLKILREVATNYKIPLIFDEVISFRLAKGGCQEIYGVFPDLTVLGKIIGGGYPAGAVAGREELMDLSSPLHATFLSHTGTFNGNPVTMVAGLTTLKELTGSEIDRINRLGGLLRTKFSEVLEEVGINAHITGMGSLAQIHFTSQEVKDWRSAATARVDIRAALHLLLMEMGIFAGKRGMFNVSTPMGENEVNEASTSLKSCLLEMRPYIEWVAPDLVFQ